jgi:hypothetical protein
MGIYPAKSLSFKNQFGLLFASALLLVAVLACGSKTPPPQQYVGSWTGDDGSLISIRNDGSGDYKSSNSSVNGGSVTIDEAAKTLKIAFVGMGPTFAIDKAPSGDRMTLSGVVYKKGGDSDTKSDDGPSKTSSSDPDVPSEEELQELARKSVLDFNEAIQTDDFSDFHSTLSKPFQKDASPEKLAGVFHEFVEAKVNFSEIEELKAKFASAPAISTAGKYEMLQLKGQYPTSPRKTNFDLKYIYEDGEWKLGSININTKNQ